MDRALMDTHKRMDVCPIAIVLINKMPPTTLRVSFIMPLLTVFSF